MRPAAYRNCVLVDSAAFARRTWRAGTPPGRLHRSNGESTERMGKSESTRAHRKFVKPSTTNRPQIPSAPIYTDSNKPNLRNLWIKSFCTEDNETNKGLILQM